MRGLVTYRPGRDEPLKILHLAQTEAISEAAKPWHWPSRHDAELQVLADQPGLYGWRFALVDVRLATPYPRPMGELLYVTIEDEPSWA